MLIDLKEKVDVILNNIQVKGGLGVIWLIKTKKHIFRWFFKQSHNNKEHFRK